MQGLCCGHNTTPRSNACASPFPGQLAQVGSKEGECRSASSTPRKIRPTAFPGTQMGLEGATPLHAASSPSPPLAFSDRLRSTHVASSSSYSGARGTGSSSRSNSAPILAARSGRDNGASSVERALEGALEASLASPRPGEVSAESFSRPRLLSEPAAAHRMSLGDRISELHRKDRLAEEQLRRIGSDACGSIKGSDCTAVGAGTPVAGLGSRQDMEVDNDIVLSDETVGPEHMANQDRTQSPPADWQLASTEQKPRGEPSHSMQWNGASASSSSSEKEGDRDSMGQDDYGVQLLAAGMGSSEAGELLHLITGY